MQIKRNNGEKGEKWKQKETPDRLLMLFRGSNYQKVSESCNNNSFSIKEINERKEVKEQINELMK